MTAKDLIDSRLIEYECEKEDNDKEQWYWRIIAGEDKIANSNRTFDTFGECKNHLINFISGIILKGHIKEKI